MPVFVFGSAKGSPGTTTVVAGVAARWPADDEVMVAEADPRGGDLATRFGLASAPGLASLATDPQAPSNGEVAHTHAQPLPPANVSALLAPAQPTPAAAAVRAAIEAGVLTAVGRSRPLLVDAGALDAGSQAMPITGEADLVLLVVRDRIEDLVHAAATLDLLGERGLVRLVVRTTGGLRPAEVGRELGVPVWAEIPSDRLSASVLCGRGLAGPGWTRLRLPRAAAGLAGTLARYIRPPTPSGAGERVGAS